jgi:hypothetical protein
MSVSPPLPRHPRQPIAVETEPHDHGTPYLLTLLPYHHPISILSNLFCTAMSKFFPSITFYATSIASASRKEDLSPVLLLDSSLGPGLLIKLHK